MLIDVSDLIQTEEADLKNYFELKNLMNRKNTKKVKFNEKDLKNEFDLSKYIACFEYASNNQLVRTKSSTDSDDLDQQSHFEICKNISMQDKKMLSSFLYSSLLKKESTFDANLFKSFLQCLPIKKIQLLVKKIKVF